MLEDQDFVSPPLVIVGPELFYINGAVKINYQQAFRFKYKVQNFTFIYAAVEESDYGPQESFVQQLSKLGCDFATVLVFSEKLTDNAALIKNLQALLVNADMVYSPEFLRKFFPSPPIAREVCFNNHPEKFMDVLVHFSTSLEPFVLRTFRNYYSQI